MDNTVQKQNDIYFIIVVLAITVVVLLGMIGYAHYTKEMMPKNKIVQFFIPQNITFNDLPLDVQQKYILKMDSIESQSEPQNIVEKKSEQEIQNKELVNKEQEVTQAPTNKFIDKMAIMQKETDKTIIQQSPEIVDKKIDKIEINNTEEVQELSEKEKRRQKFRKKMAIMQKEKDEMIIQNNGTK